METAETRGSGATGARHPGTIYRIPDTAFFFDQEDAVIAADLRLGLERSSVFRDRKQVLALLQKLEGSAAETRAIRADEEELALVDKLLICGALTDREPGTEVSVGPGSPFFVGDFVVTLEVRALLYPRIVRRKLVGLLTAAARHSQPPVRVTYRLVGADSVSSERLRGVIETLLTIHGMTELGDRSVSLEVRGPVGAESIELVDWSEGAGLSLGVVHELGPSELANRKGEEYVAALADAGHECPVALRVDGRKEFAEIAYSWLGVNEHAGLSIDSTIACTGGSPERFDQGRADTILDSLCALTNRLQGNLRTIEPLHSIVLFALLPLGARPVWRRRSIEPFVAQDGQMYASRVHCEMDAPSTLDHVFAQFDADLPIEPAWPSSSLCDQCGLAALCDRFDSPLYGALTATGRRDEAGIVASLECALRKEVIGAVLDGVAQERDGLAEYSQSLVAVFQEQSLSFTGHNEDREAK